ncbi:hypothetical protein [Nocardia sp. NPDC004711]
MPEHLHTVTIKAGEPWPSIEFTCHGDRDSECHSYPDCECESWTPGDHEHPFVPHDECWMQAWFANAADGAVDPMPESLADCDITVGMSGPIETSFRGEYVEWEFIEGPEGVTVVDRDLNATPEAMQFVRDMTEANRMSFAELVLRHFHAQHTLRKVWASRRRLQDRTAEPIADRPYQLQRAELKAQQLEMALGDRGRELDAAQRRITELEQQAGHRVIETAQIAIEPTGTVLRSAQGDVASVDHGGAGEWFGGDTRVHFLDFQLGESEFVEFLPDGQWTVLWQPEADRV